MRCKKVYPLSKMRKLGIPLPAEEVEPVETGLLWEEIQVLLQPGLPLWHAEDLKHRSCTDLVMLRQGILLAVEPGGRFR